MSREPEYLEYDRKLRSAVVDGKRIVEDSTDALYEHLVDNNLSDGLPVVPPTEERVKQMLRYTDREPGDVITEMGTSGAPLTTEKLAVNAVMAGCKPEYMPILVAAFDCMGDEDYNLSAMATTRANCSNLILVSGPLAQELGIHGGAGCMGPGFRANATIGRAANLALITVGWVVPGVVSRSVFASPARYSFCFSEQLSDYPANWKPVHEELFDAETTSVTCQVSRNPQGVAVGSFPDMTPQHILSQTCEAMAYKSAETIWGSSTFVVVLAREMAQIIAEAGWSKQDVRMFVYDHARHPIEVAEKVWPRVFEEVIKRQEPWARYAHGGRYPALSRPESLTVAVAGGPNATDGVSVIRGLSMGHTSKVFSKPVSFKDGRPITSIKDLRK